MHDDTTTEGSGRPPAVGPRLDGGVRPHATVTARLGDIASFRSTSVRKGDAVYTHAELDAAVAAERERCAKVCESIVAKDEYAYADECAAAIRGA